VEKLYGKLWESRLKNMEIYEKTYGIHDLIVSFSWQLKIIKMCTRMDKNMISPNGLMR